MRGSQPEKCLKKQQMLEMAVLGSTQYSGLACSRLLQGLPLVPELAELLLHQIRDVNPVTRSGGTWLSELSLHPEIVIFLMDLETA
ncbi:hypothetical protein EYF80_031698 [Liparis tanakae]|uniref:Uncharacterized protein n=1 Tax=Liparis tanakae TaxID=230148 RepID=A0A4Z2GXB6_9TELE|nr:hypothetical protein EYF80_031698 [Liparis tanakae]